MCDASGNVISYGYTFPIYNNKSNPAAGSIYQANGSLPNNQKILYTGGYGSGLSIHIETVVDGSKSGRTFGVNPVY